MRGVVFWGLGIKKVRRIMPQNFTITLSDRHLSKLAILASQTGLSKDTLVARFARRGIDRPKIKQSKATKHETDSWDAKKLIGQARTERSDEVLCVEKSEPKGQTT